MYTVHKLFSIKIKCQFNCNNWSDGNLKISYWYI